MMRAGKWAPGRDNWESSLGLGRGQLSQSVPTRSGGGARLQTGHGGGRANGNESGEMNTDQSFKGLITEVTIQQAPSMTGNGAEA